MDLYKHFMKNSEMWKKDDDYFEVIYRDSNACIAIVQSKIEDPVEGEEDGYAAWAGLLEEELGDEQDAGPFPESE